MTLIAILVKVLLNLWHTIRQYLFWNQSRDKQTIPLSVNYHLTRACNYRCQFCFHTALTNDRLPLAEAKRGISLFKKAGTKKLNFSGDEPFLIDHGRYVGELTRFC